MAEDPNVKYISNRPSFTSHNSGQHIGFNSKIKKWKSL